MNALAPATPVLRHAVLHLVWAVLVVLVAAGLLVAAVLVPAPAAALPFLVIGCIGLPLMAARDLDAALAAYLERRRPAQDRLDARALRELRRSLERLPETRHPLGL